MLKKYRLYLIAFIVAILLTLFCFLDEQFGWRTLVSANLTLEDSFYQKNESLSERKIVILGIDEEALNYFGPLPWSREVYADIIYMLNEDTDHAPAVIGFDVLFSGYKEEENDNYLVEAAGWKDNVVFACMATFTQEIEEANDGSFTVNDYAVETYEEPFDELKSVSSSGFINNMIGIDGIIRNSILHIDLPDGEKKNSFSYEIYKKYAEKMGLPKELDDKIKMNERYQWYLPFTSMPGEYEEISVASLFNGDIEATELEDCIVLVGAYAEGLQDSYVTAIDHSTKMNGIEIHANAIEAMLHQKFFYYADSTIQFIVLFILLVLCMIAFHKLKMSFSVLLWIGILAAYYGATLFFYTQKILLHVIYVPLLVTIVFIGNIGAKYLVAAKEKRKTVNIFKRYVAHQVVDEILKTGTDALELGGKMTDIACLFVDIRGFTPMSEALTPPQVVDVLNTYLNLTNDCIMKNEGTLDKFIGDATMAIYNAPLPLEDYIYKAVKTAWDMVQGADILGKQLKEKYGRDVSFGIGVHCGKAVVGNIGTKMRMDYTAIGDTVNTAARLEANAKPGEILISKDVYEALKGRIKVSSYGTSIQLKGKQEGFEIYRVDSING